MLSSLQTERFQSVHARLRSDEHELEATCRGLLTEFNQHDLTSAGETLLADRSETKYLMPVDVLPDFVAALADGYSVLNFSSTPISTYEVTYFDTPDRDHYLAHHNGRRQRMKYRLRRYAETDTSFLEIKLKHNKQRSLKTRLLWDVESRNEENLRQLMGDRLDGFQPALHINYRRMSFWNRDSDDRLTLDFDLRFQRPDSVTGVRLPDIFVVELKRRGKAHGSPFYRRAKSYGFLPQSVSKYCVGTCLTDDGSLKSNRFKPVLSRIGRALTTGEPPNDC